MSEGRQPQRWASVELGDREAPSAPALSIAFDDEDSRPGVLHGNLTLLPAPGTAYNVHFASRNGSVLESLGPLASFMGPGPNQTTVACPPCPAGAAQLIARPAGAGGEVPEMQIALKIVDRTGAAPSSGPLRVAFFDEDPNPGLLAGPVVVSVPQPEAADVQGYRVYFEGDSGRIRPPRRGGRPDWAAEAQATGADVETRLPMGTEIPGGAHRMVVVAFNADGEGTASVGMGIWDIGSARPSFDSTVLEIVSVSVAVLVACIMGCLWLMLRTRCRFWLEKAMDNDRSTRRSTVSTDRGTI